MTINSMTGFGRTDGQHGPTRWHWELRSVNGRGLDLRFRLPPGFDQIEPKLRELAQKRLLRGNVSATLSLQRESAGTAIRLNEATLMQALAAADRAAELMGANRPPLEALLAIRGVLEVAEAEEAGDEATQKAILSSFEVAVEGLASARAAEGRRLADVLADQLAQIEKLVESAAASPARSVEAIRVRMAEQVARLLDASSTLDPARLHQEAALIATRADIEEEIKRLGSHIAAARELVNASEPVGRKLEFLTQEFNREANTLCSKANAPDLTKAGLALKAVIDQMREQVQNIE